MTSQVRSKVAFFHRFSLRNALQSVNTSNKRHVIEKHRWSVGCLIHMLPKEVIDARSVHRGQVTKGHNMNPTMLGSCDTCFMANFTFRIQWCGLDGHWGQFRLHSGGGQVKVRSKKVKFQS